MEVWASGWPRWVSPLRQRFRRRWTCTEPLCPTSAMPFVQAARSDSLELVLMTMPWCYVARKIYETSPWTRDRGAAASALQRHKSQRDILHEAHWRMATALPLGSNARCGLASNFRSTPKIAQSHLRQHPRVSLQVVSDVSRIHGMLRRHCTLRTPKARRRSTINQRCSVPLRCAWPSGSNLNGRPQRTSCEDCNFINHVDNCRDNVPQHKKSTTTRRLTSTTECTSEKPSRSTTRS